MAAIVENATNVDDKVCTHACVCMQARMYECMYVGIYPYMHACRKTLLPLMLILLLTPFGDAESIETHLRNIMLPIYVYCYDGRRMVKNIVYIWITYVMMLQEKMIFIIYVMPGGIYCLKHLI